MHYSFFTKYSMLFILLKLHFFWPLHQQTHSSSVILSRESVSLLAQMLATDECACAPFGPMCARMSSSLTPGPFIFTSSTVHPDHASVELNSSACKACPSRISLIQSSIWCLTTTGRRTKQEVWREKVKV